MSLGWIKKRLQMHRLWIKKEKMAAHPIAEASITLCLALSLSPCLSEDSQLGRAVANQKSETESEGGVGGGSSSSSGSHNALQLLQTG